MLPVLPLACSGSWCKDGARALKLGLLMSAIERDCLSANGIKNACHSMAVQHSYASGGNSLRH